MAEYESVVCVKNEVCIYHIPARTSNRGYRAADWKLDEPDWKGRLKVITKGRDLSLKLEDKISGELFAQCPVDGYPSSAIEQVVDSSRYFVIRIQDGSGRHAFIGLGFADRGDSFDLLVAIQDHFKHVKRDDTTKVDEINEGASTSDSGPKLDLSFKEGQTIKLTFAAKKVTSDKATKAKSKGQATSVLLPPSPGGSKVISSHQSRLDSHSRAAGPTLEGDTSQPASIVDLLLDVNSSIPSSITQPATQPIALELASDLASKLKVKPSAATNADEKFACWENFE